MIEQALYDHLREQGALLPYLARYDGAPAIFNQSAPADTDPLWRNGAQYGRLVFAVDLQGDPERAMGGTLTVDILCHEDEQFPEDMEPIVRELVHGWFFSSGTFTAAAQWKNSSYFTEETSHVTGCTVTFDLLAFPILTTSLPPDVIRRVNEWTEERFKALYVINAQALPDSAWKPKDGDSAVYWRLVNDDSAGWIPDTFQTIWRTATIRCHIFSEDHAAAGMVAMEIIRALYGEKRIGHDGEAPILVNQRNTIDMGADPLRTGQLTVEATYGVIVCAGNSGTIQHIFY